MFTGIIEAVGTIRDLTHEQGNLLLTVASPLAAALKIDQSVSHNGACLTVTATGPHTHQVVAVAETLAKTNLGSLKAGDRVNLERSLELGQRLDGHLVQGHVDATGTCTAISGREGSREFRISFPPAFAHLLIEKGSVALNGISLTVFNLTADAFSVAVIPYTLAHTTMGDLKAAEAVNLEFDLIGKYLSRWRQVEP
jgi:riboflavin synthase